MKKKLHLILLLFSVSYLSACANNEKIANLSDVPEIQSRSPSSAPSCSHVFEQQVKTEENRLQSKPQ